MFFENLIYRTFIFLLLDEDNQGGQGHPDFRFYCFVMLLISILLRIFLNFLLFLFLIYEK